MIGFPVFKNGTLRITQKGRKLAAQIAVEHPKPETTSHEIVGIDLGLKILAVCATDTGKVRFVGNGRKNKYLKCKFCSDRKRLGKAQKRNAIRKRRNKEQRILRDIDHKIGRKIVNFAKNNHVAVIRMEQLTNIHATARTSRKNISRVGFHSLYLKDTKYDNYASIIQIEQKPGRFTVRTNLCLLE